MKKNEEKCRVATINLIIGPTEREDSIRQMFDDEDIISINISNITSLKMVNAQKIEKDPIPNEELKNAGYMQIIHNEDDARFAKWYDKKENPSPFDMMRMQERITKERLKTLERERGKVMENLKSHGSAFERSLANTIGWADKDNLLKIWRAWSGIWTKYRDWK